MKLDEFLREVKAKKNKKLALFAGAGISLSSGLPTWPQFLDSYIKFCEKLLQNFIDLKDNNNPNYTEEIIDDFKETIRIASDSKSDPLIAISVLNLKLKEYGKFHNNLSTQLYKQVYQVFTTKSPSKIHSDIIKSNFSCIITTNYDDLLEKAADDLNHIDYKNNIYDYTQVQEIATCLYNNRRFILHMHGSINSFLTSNPNLIVTKSDYQKISKDEHIFRFLLKHILLTNDLLFIGFGNTDPHIKDIIAEMDYFFPPNGLDLPTYYLLVDEVSDIENLHSKYSRLQYVIIDFKKDLDTLFEELSK